MKIHEVEQGTEQWLALRANFPTASEFACLVSPVKLKVNDGKAIRSYVAQKLAEKWLGAPLQAFGGFGATDQGKVREEEARPWYALNYDVEVRTVGFITNDDGTAGCSPDGLIVGQNKGVEIKCGEPDTHVKWLVAGELPAEHLMQVQGSMLVCGYEEWDFVSYHPKFPKFVVPVRRNRLICEALTEALNLYWELFNAGWGQLLEANGGEEPSRNYESSFAGGDEVRTLKREFTGADPIGDLLEGR